MVAETVKKDVNHASILFWNNGNERGWNTELDDDFAIYDPQNRTVLHPIDTFGGIDTDHYETYNSTVSLLQGPTLYMTTEFLHGLYDGGHGAGLDDYWNATLDSPYGAGGFLWALTDEGVVRVDQSGQIDVNGNKAPDGIVGPYREKEGSYYTIKEIWSPVHISMESISSGFDGVINVDNRYAFTNLSQCQFSWEWADVYGPDDVEIGCTTVQSGSVAGPNVTPGNSGYITITVPGDYQDRDVLYLTAIDPQGQELWRWSWNIKTPSDHRESIVTIGSGSVIANEIGDILSVTAGSFVANFDLTTGYLLDAQKNGQALSFGNGPQFIPPAAGSSGGGHSVVAVIASSAQSGNGPENTIDGNLNTRWSTSGDGVWIRWDLGEVKTFSQVFLAWQRGNERRAYFDLEVSSDASIWQTVISSGQSSGTTTQLEAHAFAQVNARYVRLTGHGNSTNMWTSLLEVVIGSSSSASGVTHGTDPDGYFIEWTNGSDNQFRWTIYPSGWLKLDYSMTLSGSYDYFGVTFDYPEQQVLGKKWLGDGPYRVWKNRLKGTTTNVWQNDYNDNIPGQQWNYPEFTGYFADMQWLKLQTQQGDLTVVTDTEDLFLRVYTPQNGENPRKTETNFPTGDISFLHGISGIGTKFKYVYETGPQGQQNQANGTYRGSLYLRW